MAGDNRKRNTGNDVDIVSGQSLNYANSQNITIWTQKLTSFLALFAVVCECVCVVCLCVCVSLLFVCVYSMCV